MRERWLVAGVLGGMGLLVLAIVVAVQFGRHDPSPPSLEDEPISSIPGEIAFFDTDQCLSRVPAAGGTPRVIRCDVSYAQAIAWLDARTIALFQPRAPNDYDQIRIDTETGAQAPGAGKVTFDPRDTGPDPVSVNGERAQVDRDGRLFILKANGDKEEIANFDVAEFNGPQPRIWSPDGNWLLLRYYNRNSDGIGSELWIISRDGKTRGTLVANANDPVTWRIEGIGVTPRVTLRE